MGSEEKTTDVRQAPPQKGEVIRIPAHATGTRTARLIRVTDVVPIPYESDIVLYDVHGFPVTTNGEHRSFSGRLGAARWYFGVRADEVQHLNLPIRTTLTKVYPTPNQWELRLLEALAIPLPPRNGWDTEEYLEHLRTLARHYRRTALMYGRAATILHANGDSALAVSTARRYAMTWAYDAEKFERDADEMARRIEQEREDRKMAEAWARNREEDITIIVMEPIEPPTSEELEPEGARCVDSVCASYRNGYGVCTECRGTSRDPRPASQQEPSLDEVPAEPRDLPPPEPNI